MSEITPEIWTASEIAKWLKLSPRYVAENLSKRNGFPGQIAVGRGRWLKDDIIDWVNQSTQQCHRPTRGNKQTAG